MTRLFQILAVVLVGIAAYFLWIGWRDHAFVIGVLAAVAFFLGIRVDLKDRNRICEAEKKEAEANLLNDDPPGPAE